MSAFKTLICKKRRRKVDEDEEEEEIDEDIVEANECQTSGGETVQKQKRKGRPPKDQCQRVDDETVQTKKKRGRPRKCQKIGGEAVPTQKSTQSSYRGNLRCNRKALERV